MDFINVAIAFLIWLSVLALACFVVYSWLSRQPEQRRSATPSIRKIGRGERLRHNGGKHTNEEWLQLCTDHNNRCAKCGADAILTKDHIVPVSLGGSDSIDNLQPLCRSCNASKGTKIIDYRTSNNRARHIQSCPARLTQEN